LGALALGEGETPPGPPTEAELTSSEGSGDCVGDGVGFVLFTFKYHVNIVKTKVSFPKYFYKEQIFWRVV
jgi:hypothetical protein